MRKPFYTELADAIYYGLKPRHSVASQDPKVVTLSETAVINGRTFNPGVTLSILKPVVSQ